MANLTQEEIDDLILVLEKQVEGGLCSLTNDFSLIEGQPEDMMVNLESALIKLRATK
jgi:hypothetical protein